jgi:hypothetical protein
MRLNSIWKLGLLCIIAIIGSLIWRQSFSHILELHKPHKKAHTISAERISVAELKDWYFTEIKKAESSVAYFDRLATIKTNEYLSTGYFGSL